MDDHGAAGLSTFACFMPVKAGGKEPRPKQDHGFVVLRSFEDLDGHTWEPFWMDPAHVMKG